MTSLFPARESLVSDIPAGDGKLAYLFLQCNKENAYDVLLWNKGSEKVFFVSIVDVSEKDVSPEILKGWCITTFPVL